MDINEGFSLIKEFYENAWHTLILIVSGAAAAMILIMGVVMPLLLQWTQNRREKKEIQEIRNIAKETIDNKINEIEKKFIEIEKSINITTGGVLYVQAFNSNIPIIRFYSLLLALNIFLKADSVRDINKTFSFLIEVAKKINEIKDKETKEIYDQVIKTVEEYNKDDIYTDRLRELKRIVENLASPNKR
jgi:transcription initiation factor TFIIIB Brf1 subunit/transcription initiation factor TFIIB